MKSIEELEEGKSYLLALELTLKTNKRNTFIFTRAFFEGLSREIQKMLIEVRIDSAKKLLAILYPLRKELPNELDYKFDAREVLDVFDKYITELKAQRKT